jgi:trans-aconitate methyltransferase
MLHPSVPASGPLRIADIGAGTGVFPIELSQQLPNASIIGFDISNAQFPPVEWLPLNVSLHVHDAFTPFPESHIGQYDIVHMRFFVTLLKSEDEVQRLVENLAALLSESQF